MAGRKPLPTKLKVVKGTAQNCRTNKREPKAELGIPVCPDWLSPLAKKEWAKQTAQLSRMGVLTMADDNSLAIYCHIVGEIKTLAAKIAEQGYLSYDIKVNQDTGEEITCNPKANPLAVRLEKLYSEYRLYSGMFGLDPSTRSKIQHTESDEKNEFDDF